MEQISLRLPARTLAELERDAAEHDRTRSEHIRDVLESHRDALGDTPDPERVRELERQLAECQRDLERARREKRLILAERDEKAELVEYVEQERSAEQRWREAGLATRLKWRVFGMSNDDEKK